MIPEDKVVDKLKDILETLLDKELLTSNNILDILLNLMIAIEKFENIKGEQKKNVIIQVFNIYLEDKDDVSNELKELVKFLLPKIIDTFISIDKREVKIKVSKCLKITKKYLCCS